MIKMIFAGNAEPSFKHRFTISLTISILLYIITYILFWFTSSLTGVRVDHVTLSLITSFTLLLGLLILRVFKNTDIMHYLLTFFSILTVVTYYLYIASIVTTRRLTFTLMPFFLIITNGIYATYIIDIPQIILITYAVSFILRKVFTQKPK